jgi:hypothetical protein
MAAGRDGVRFASGRGEICFCGEAGSRTQHVVSFPRTKHDRNSISLHGDMNCIVDADMEVCTIFRTGALLQR